MTQKLQNEEIVNILGKEKTVEKIMYNILKRRLLPMEQDLCQDLYISLLELDNNLLNKLYQEDEIRYYIVKMIKFNIFSTTSKYWRQYKKFDYITSNIEDLRTI